eukprot:g4946.t1
MQYTERRKAATIAFSGGIVQKKRGPAADVAKNPILFMGGMGASTIDATLTKTTVVHDFCWKNAENYRVWLPYSGLLPGVADCFLDNFKLTWKKRQRRPRPRPLESGPGGTTTTGSRSGGTGGGLPRIFRGSSGSKMEGQKAARAPDEENSAEPEDEEDDQDPLILDESEVQAYASGDKIEAGTGSLTDGLLKSLWDALGEIARSKFGYDSPRQINNLYFDFRKSPREWFVDGTFARTKSRIETYVDEFNAGKPALLVALSEGCNFLHQFLALFVDDAWKAKYVHHFLSLSGPYGGTPELTRMAFYPQPADVYHVPELLFYIKLRALRDVSVSFPSTLVGMPTYLDLNETLVTDKDGRGYKQTELGEALRAAGQPNTAVLLDMQKGRFFFDALPPPRVSTTCIHGVGIPTLKSMTYGAGWDQEASDFEYETGDGVVPARSLVRCQEWTRMDPDHPPVSLLALDGASHGGPLRNATVA